MTTTRFTQTSERYEVDSSSTVYTAQAEVQPGHVVTRDHAHSNAFGPVPGSHHVTYTCTCGATAVGQHAAGPRSSDMDRMVHFADASEREAHEAAEVAHRDRVLRMLGMES